MLAQGPRVADGRASLVISAHQTPPPADTGPSWWPMSGGGGRWGRNDITMLDNGWMTKE